MKIAKHPELPSESGFYFVKTKNAQYWQCLVRIVGKVPFLHITFTQSLFKTNDSDIITGDLTTLDWSEVMSLDNVSDNTLEKEALDYMRDGAKLQAVKHVKEKTGWGLKESKEWCDALQAKYLK
jgi:hypothetical protein